jgi:hypothetical protein
MSTAASSAFLHSPSSRRGFRTLVLGLVVLATYVAYRGAPAARGAEGEDFERARATRHLVGLAARVDKDALRRWLEEQDARDAAEKADAAAATAGAAAGGAAAAAGSATAAAAAAGGAPLR